MFSFQGDSAEEDDGSDSAQDFSEDDHRPSKATVASTVKAQLSGKRKRSAPSKPEKNIKKSKTVDSASKREKKHVALPPPTHPPAEATKTVNGRKRKNDEEHGDKSDAAASVWNSRNVDHDLDDHAASNVRTKRIKISNNLIVSCRMISTQENKNLHQDYAALVFSRRTNKEKTFDFMIDMRWTDRIITALDLIMKENPVFFKSVMPPTSSRTTSTA